MSSSIRKLHHLEREDRTTLANWVNRLRTELFRALTTIDDRDSEIVNLRARVEALASENARLRTRGHVSN